MALGDGLAKAFPLATRAAGFGTRDAGAEAGASGSAYASVDMKDLRTTTRHLQCEISTMTGPFACMHDEHLTIIENQKVMNAKLDRILAYLQAHFCPPPQ